MYKTALTLAASSSEGTFGALPLWHNSTHREGHLHGCQPTPQSLGCQWWACQHPIGHFLPACSQPAKSQALHKAIDKRDMQRCSVNSSPCDLQGAVRNADLSHRSVVW